MNTNDNKTNSKAVHGAAALGTFNTNPLLTACVRSINGQKVRATTTNPAEVTCKACLARMGKKVQSMKTTTKVVVVSTTVANVDVTARGRTNAEAYDNLAQRLIEWNLFDRASDEMVSLRWTTVETDR